MYCIYPCYIILLYIYPCYIYNFIIWYFILYFIFFILYLIKTYIFICYEIVIVSWNHQSKIIKKNSRCKCKRKAEVFGLCFWFRHLHITCTSCSNNVFFPVTWVSIADDSFLKINYFSESKKAALNVCISQTFLYKCLTREEQEQLVKEPTIFVYTIKCQVYYTTSLGSKLEKRRNTENERFYLHY